MIGVQVEQKGHKFYVVKAKAQDLDRLCWVPQIDSTKRNSELAREALGRSVDRWQRQVDFDRLEDIGRFFNEPRNYFVNAAVIALDVEEGTPELQVSSGIANFNIETNWMKQKCPECGYYKEEQFGKKKVRYWFDRCPNQACSEHKVEQMGRGYIIDGQHRIRGSQNRQNTDHREEFLVATVLTHSEFPSREQAKIFTEITTAARDLDPLHKVFLLFKFGLRARRIQQIKDADFRRDTPVGRRNRRAYEIACRLCSDSNTHLKNRITILRDRDDRMKRGDYVEITALVPILSRWLDRNEVLSDPSQSYDMKTEEDAFRELEDYFRAIEEKWSGQKYWKNNRHSAGALQHRGIFYILLNLFEAFSKRIDRRGATRAYTEYLTELTLLEEIKWEKQEWQRWRAPERDRNLLLKVLRTLVEDAPLADANGFGPLSDLNTYIGRTPTDFKWTKNTLKLQEKSMSKLKFPVTVKWTGIPTNAYETASIAVNQGKTLLSGDVRTNRYVIEACPSLDTSKKAMDVVIQVIYANPNGETELVLKMKP
jgi:DGQHR domain-containing protein